MGVSDQIKLGNVSLLFNNCCVFSFTFLLKTSLSPPTYKSSFVRVRLQDFLQRSSSVQCALCPAKLKVPLSTCLYGGGVSAVCGVQCANIFTSPIPHSPPLFLSVPCVLVPCCACDNMRPMLCIFTVM